MSPLSLRRYRAERLLREEFQGLRTKVLATVRSRLATQGALVDLADLEACYAQAWQGLYAAVLAGQEIANPTGWLVLVTFRRAIEDQRSSHYERRADIAADDQSLEPDLASQMDDHRRLRQVFEALRERLNPRECQAASLCYLQGLSRADAAQRMGISEARMRKLMEGDGLQRPGVAAKMGELLSIIREGGWCEEQSSLMRGFAFGILDPEGERYQLALLHQRECPACRAYVASLRGLAAVFPPLLFPLGFGAAAGAGAGAGAGALSGAGAGVGAGGSGWLLAGGSLSAKFAGCLVALGLSAGCLELVTHQKHTRSSGHLSVAGLGRVTTATEGSVLLPASSVTRLPVFGPAPVKPKNKKSNPRPLSVGPQVKPTRARIAGHGEGNASLAALAEFGPERPRIAPSVPRRAAPAPVQAPSRPQPAAAHSSAPSSSHSGSEFGFEETGH
jgi:RNA polymerase sigma factor (sigma-70 family)